MREPSSERGFTLIELMMVVAIIAVLAIIVVPTFTREAHKTKGATEVNAMFAQMSMKEETYKNESGSYLAATQCPAGGPNHLGYTASSTFSACDAAWSTLRIAPPESKMRCAYTIVTGTKADTLTPPTGFKNSAGTVSAAESNLAQSWWYMTAQCDEDGQGGTNATYYQSSVDPTIQVQNSGS